MITRRTALLSSVGALAGLVAGCSESLPDPQLTPSGPSDPSRTPSPSAPGSSAPSTSARPGPSRSPTAIPSTTASPSGAPRLMIGDTVAEGLDVPWGIAFTRDGGALVSERNSGRIVRISPKGRLSSYGRIRGVAAPTGVGEGGLLGIALAPGDDDTLFAYLTSASDNRIVRVSVDNGRVGRPRAVLTGIPTSTHHHGGRLLFDPDGQLVVSTGDAEQSALAQNRRSLAGKILRIRPDGRASAGNPFGNRTWSYGHRNVEGLAFDARGRLWATEFGDKRADELNVIRRGGNYGWPEAEGDQGPGRRPRATWAPTSTCSPAGLAITRSTAFVGALQGRCLFSVPLTGVDAGEPKPWFAGDHGRIRTVVVAPDGALWMTTSNTDGRSDPGPDDDRIIRVTLQ